MREELLCLIEAPVTTEKSESLRQARNQYTFRVRRCAGKRQIKRAIETAFNVQVASVRTCTVKGKERRFQGVLGRTSSWKKAYVKLNADSPPIEMSGNP